MKKLSKQILFFCLASLLHIANVEAATWYADPSGTSANSGTTSSDATSIQYAINWANAGDTVELAAGTYNIVSQINIANDVIIKGAGAGATILDGSSMPPGSIIVASSPYSPVFTLRDMTLQNSVGEGLAIHDGNATVENVEFLQMGIGAYFNGPLAYGSVKSSVFEDNLDMAIYATGSNLTEISGCTFSGSGLAATGYGAVFLYYNESLVSVSDNDFISNYVGLDIRTPSGSVSRVIAEQNYFSDNEWGVYIESSGTGNNILRQNTIASSLRFGIVVTGKGDESLITQNEIHGGNDGIVLESVFQTIVTNNVVHDNEGVGIGTASSKATVGFNTVAQNASNGFSAINLDQSTYLNNIAYQNGGYGFSIDASSSGVALGYNNSHSNSSGHYFGPFKKLGGNRNVNPLFVSSTDYHLQSTSPLIDAARLMSLSEDHDGGASRSLPNDIGAYEY